MPPSVAAASSLAVRKLPEGLASLPEAKVPEAAAVADQPEADEPVL